MQQKLYENKNNLLQSPEWLSFQKDYGRSVVDVGDYHGIELAMPLGKKAIWIQRGPKSISNFKLPITNLPEGTVFVRLEPAEITEKAVRKLGAREVTKTSLLCGQVSPKATRLLNIDMEMENILAQMKPKTRYNIRLSEKKGVIIKETDKVDVFYQLLSKTASRDKGYSPHENDYYAKIMATLGKGGSVKIFVAEHEGEPLAAIMVSFYGQVATYLHGGFNDTKRNLMAPYLCQWSAIKVAKEHGCQIYDFWGVAESDDENDPWAGISRFKEGFGGEKVIYPGGYDLVVNKFWYNSFTFLAKLRRIIK